MIKVALMNGSEIVLNSDLIEFIEATPDTLIALSTGKKMMVRESVQEVIDRILDFRQRLTRPAQELETKHSIFDQDEESQD